MNYDPNTGPPYGSFPGSPPYGGPVYLLPHRGGIILTLGILSLLCTCLPLGIIAWVLGNTDLAAIREGRMDRAGEGITRAGQILGIITCAINGLFVLLYAIALIIGVGGAMLGGNLSP